MWTTEEVKKHYLRILGCRCFGPMFALMLGENVNLPSTLHSDVLPTDLFFLLTNTDTHPPSGICPKKLTDLYLLQTNYRNLPIPVPTFTLPQKDSGKRSLAKK